jgi:tetratricopeptide (TPR) repeat protein
MAKLARLPISEGALGSAVASLRRVPRARPRYFAFLSYSHKDEEIADWLHRELEDYRVPAALAGRLTANGVTPKRLSPIFRDEHELAAADDLSEEIEEALSASQFLIVLCSPNAAKSRWTNAEIEAFKRARPDGCVLAAIAAGEPFASDIPGREEEECFPPALRQKYDRRGRPTGKRAEPLAADLREEGDGRRMGFLKLVAGMLGVGLDDLVHRETTRRHRRLAWLAAGSLAGMAVTSTLAFTAIQARDAARDQRREAEGLVAFMLGDLKDKLEPIGRLDALDGVGSRVLGYYSKQDKSELPDESLLQRSRALSLMASVATSRGDLNGALRLYREAEAGTAEAIRRKPDDPQRLFDHAQSVFYSGEIKRNLGDNKGAEDSMREYKRLALRMVQLEPDNMRWRMEVQYADTNLGIVLYGQRRFPESTHQFQEARTTIEAFATAEPNNLDYQENLTEGLAWLADSKLAEGRLQDVITIRERQVALLGSLLRSTGDVYYRLRLIPAERSLGNVYASRGQMGLAVQHLRSAADHGRRLIPLEPENANWRENAFTAELNLARILFIAGQTDEAAAHLQTGCDLVSGLLRVDSTIPTRREGLRDCWMLRARIALTNGQQAKAMEAAQRAVSVAKSVKTTDSIHDRYVLADAYRLLGDVQRRRSDLASAHASWATALATIPHGATERPEEMAVRARILQRLGRTAEAKPLKDRLASIGYRNPEFSTASIM